ncbi:hypothetical protein RND71_040577 [Anisodus tanguticus]|uniref:Uncharacterized protein n=1 Tax=Anisodus tanguticus TaxID=243964 RepID=A0AAE1UVU8_9SOLA|nr:hypothetical protein RND71_040577 [Anisodus tanguticus]
MASQSLPTSGTTTSVPYVTVLLISTSPMTSLSLPAFLPTISSPISSFSTTSILPGLLPSSGGLPNRFTICSPVVYLTTCDRMDAQEVVSILISLENSSNNLLHDCRTLLPHLFWEQNDVAASTILGTKCNSGRAKILLD